jgi:VCBS repeat protein
MPRSLRWWLAAAALAAALLSGCIKTSAFSCDEDEQCSTGGMCIVNRCAFADPTCGSQWRYDDSAGDLANTCTPSDGPDGDDDDDDDGGPDAGPFVRDVCLEGPRMARGGDACVDAVCAEEGRCCDDAWTDACVHLAGRLCRDADHGSRDCRSDVSVAGGSSATIVAVRHAAANLPDASAIAEIGAGPYLLDSAWSDYDGDGDADYAVASDGQMWLFEGSGVERGELVLEPPFVYPSERRGGSWTSVRFGDADGDGIQEVLFATSVLGVEVIRRGPGVWEAANVWTPPAEDAGADISVFASWIQLDSDPGLEIVAVRGRTLHLFDLREDGWNETALEISGGDPGLTAGDLAVGWDQVAVTGFGITRVLHANGNGGLVEESQEIGNATNLAWGDLDNDGRLDLALGWSFYVAFYRRASGSFVEIANPDVTTGDNVRDLDWGDMDGDGDLDLVVAAFGQPHAIWVNHHGEGATPPFPRVAASVDFNGQPEMTELECVSLSASLGDP